MENCTDEKHKSAWFSFLKTIATFRGDLASLTAPPFLLSPQSMIEYSTYWAEHPSLFVAPALESDPEKRMILVLKWFLSTLKQQHSSVDENGQKKKFKPLNPFLGEVFQGQWVDDAGETKLVAEQVSHHPPITAFNCWNARHGIRLRGHVRPRAYFSGTVYIDRKGYSVLHIDEYDEDYLITMPKAHVEGLITASIQLELSCSSFIRSSSGYTAKINYSNKGWLRGKRNSFVANVYCDKCKDDMLYTVDGQWSGIYTFKDARTQEVLENFDTSSLPTTPLQVAPIEEQHPLESRRAWQHVAEAINRGDIFSVGREKSKIENEQRALRRRERVDGTEFPRQYFSRAKYDLVAETLASGVDDKAPIIDNIDDMQGLWIWDDDKYCNIQGKRSVG